jgi:integrase/recombinase XerD
MEPLSRDELLTLLSAARESSLRDWALLLTIYAHGLRASEAGELKRADLNEKDWTLKIVRGKGSKTTLQTVMPNGEKLLNERKALDSWLSGRPNSPYLFPNPAGGPLSRISVYNVIKKAAQASGLPGHKAAPHALRHSLGQAIHDSGQSIEVCAEILGHSRLDSSRHYYRISFQEANDARQVAINFRT